MSADYEIDTDRRIIFSTASGVLTEDDLRGHRKQLRADPFFDPSFDQLWDCSEVTKVAVGIEVVRFLSRSSSYEAGAKRAVVAPDDITFGLARMFQTLHEDAPEEVRIFRSREEARRWLKLD